MAACARLAARARPIARPNPGVAAIAVRDGCVITRGWTQAGGRPHAEAHAFEGLPPDALHRATLYVTLEPCAHQSQRGPACSDLIAALSPERVVIGQLDPDPRTAGSGIRKLEEAGIRVHLLEDEPSARSLAGYLMQKRQGRPYVTLKLAQSLDGAIALGNGASQWITQNAARTHCHAMRAKNDAILVGAGTWRSDKPKLTVRLPGLENRSPDRVLLTRGVAPEGVRVINEPTQICDLEDVMHLYVEGGAQTAASFLKSDLVDELHIYQAPILIGGDGLSSLGAMGLADLAHAHGRWTRADSRALGRDVFTAYWRTHTDTESGV